MRSTEKWRLIQWCSWPNSLYMKVKSFFLLKKKERRKLGFTMNGVINFHIFRHSPLLYSVGGTWLIYTWVTSIACMVVHEMRRLYCEDSMPVLRRPNPKRLFAVPLVAMSNRELAKDKRCRDWKLGENIFQANKLVYSKKKRGVIMPIHDVWWTNSAGLLPYQFSVSFY